MASQDPSQNQQIGDGRIENSELQLLQAGRDAIGFQNSHENQVTINNAIVQLFGRSQPASVDWDWAGRVIKEQQAEVRNRLKYVLRDRAPLSLQLSEQPERVNLPALESERRLTIAGQDSELLDPGQLMIEVFRRDDIAGKLLILGTPGAGKTTVLLSLAEQVLIGAIGNPKTVIPIVFEISTWKNDNQSIRDWLIEQLYDLYGGNRKLKRYEQWLEQRVLLPLLDGLDELGMERQQKCMAKLNEFTRQYPQVVVCCRSKEFEESGIRLGNLRGAIALEPLSDRQIQTYLQQVEREGLWHQIQETPEMRQMMEPNKGEAGLLRVPLFVSLAAAIYDKDQPFRTKGELLERYIDRQLSFDVRMSDRRKGLEQHKWSYQTVEEEPAIRATCHYLAWLAHQLNDIDEVNFLIERMQPSWLEKPQYERLYMTLCALSIGLSGGLTARLSVGSLSLEVGLSFLVVFGLGRLIFGTMDIQPVETLQISISSVTRREIIHEFKLALISGLTLGLIGGLIGLWITPKLTTVLFLELYGLGYGLVLGLGATLFKLIYGLKQDLKVRSYPNQGIRNSFHNFCLSSIVANIVIAITLVILFCMLSQIVPGKSINETFIEELPRISFFFFFLIPIVTCFTFFFFGGLSFVQHFCLRFVLAYSGKFPFFCVPFLNYCTERRLLQRIGGRYRFIHRELLEYFASKAILDSSLRRIANF